MKNKDIEQDMKESVIRNWSVTIMEFLKERISKETIGSYYQWMHNIIIFGGVIVILFNNNPIHLIIMLILVSLDAFANVVCHNCPLTSLERKYLGNSLSHERRKLLKDSGIMYKCSHIYESQVELIVNIWTMVAAKIVVVLAIKTFTPSYLSLVSLSPSF